MATESATNATVIGLQNGGSYQFEVAAQSAVGVGPASAPSAVVVLPDLPSAPLEVQGAPGPGAALLTWSPPASNGGAPLMGYAILQRQYNELDFSPSVFTQASPTACSATVTGLVAGSYYTFEIAALNEVGEGPFSSPGIDVATASVPLAPTLISATAIETGVVQVKWLEPSYNGGLPLTGYTVVTTPGAPLQTVDGGTLAATVGDLDPATAYQFSVYASNAVGDGPPSASSAPVTPTVPLSLPGAPATPAVVAGIRGAQLTFAPGSAGGGIIDSYAVDANDGSGLANATVESLDTSGANVIAQVTGLANGTTYTFVVIAHNQAGSGPPSTPSAPATTARLPAQPIFGQATLSQGTATLHWSDATVEAAHPVTLYTLTQLQPPGSPTLTSATNSIQIGGLDGGTAYLFPCTAPTTSATAPSPPPARRSRLVRAPSIRRAERAARPSMR